jgi:hypothetical protein
MRPFASAAEMLMTHETMFGPAGRFCAEAVLRHAETLFDEPIDPLRFRVILAPGEMGAYDSHAGYTTADQALPIILLNRHICHICGGAIALDNERNTEDTIVHELTQSASSP